ncbi:hypothetical protein [Streptomyces sp. YIM 98790]|uniref:hypothetical protein n=1 Tax=Streptomyces sp. YIM 98790 TaxID=2689077 RepID=UPI0014079A9B|nr:hypothetical protein [Streptomyces sp. YIM 98790]
MKRIRYASVAALLALGITAGTAGGAAAAPAESGRPAPRAGEPGPREERQGEESGQRTFTTWAAKVNVRHNEADPARCNASPSVPRCPDARGQVNPGDSFEAWCQKEGSQTVGGNPYWVYVITPGFEGWLAGYYVGHPDDVLPDTPWCV